MGINVSDIHSNIYNSYSKERLLLLGFCINQRLRIFDDMKLAYFYVSKEDQQHFAAKKGDMEGVVNYTLMMQNIEVGALVKENEEGIVRISFRSKNDFNVNDFARKYFSGGGHRKASGATSTMNLEDTCKYMEECFRKELL
jgi:phosphoesterase RecJ-like protein